MTKILPSITTTSVFGRDWRKQFEEIKKINLEEVAFFPTCLKEKKIRQEAYKLLEDSPIESIPFVHLREDMDIEEIEQKLTEFKEIFLPENFQWRKGQKEAAITIVETYYNKPLTFLNIF